MNFCDHGSREISKPLSCLLIFFSSLAILIASHESGSESVVGKEIWNLSHGLSACTGRDCTTFEGESSHLWNKSVLHLNAQVSAMGQCD